MAGITSAMTDSFRSELAQAIHNFTTTTGNVFKCALFIAGVAGTFGKGTTNYSQMGADELATAAGYTRPGFAWTAAQNTTPSITNHVATWTWSVNPSWTSATFSTDGCLIYNSTAGGNSCGTYSFGSTQTVTSGTMTLVLPTNNDASAILRLA